VHFPGPTNKAEQHFSFYLAYVLLSAQSLARACPEIVSSCTTKLAESESQEHRSPPQALNAHGFQNQHNTSFQFHKKPTNTSEK
jgi:hypothetical protein